MLRDDALDVVSGDFEFDDFVCAFFALLDESVAGDDDELLSFGVVPVLAFGDSRLGDVLALASVRSGRADGDLSAVEGVDEFGEGASLFNVHLQ